MAISLYCMNFLVPVGIIKAKYPGGWEQCLEDHASRIGSAVWFDEYLFNESAMDPHVIDRLMVEWESRGFQLTEPMGGEVFWKDVCCIERGPYKAPTWLTFAPLGHSVYLSGTEPGKCVTPGWLDLLQKRNAN